MRFSLRMLMLLVIPAAFGALLLVRWIDHRPIQWTPYSPTVFADRCQDGNPMILFFGADWDLNSLVIRDGVFEDPVLKRSLRRRGVQMVYADMTSPSPAVKTAISRIGQNTTPFITFYFPNAINTPIVIHNIPSPTEISDTLATSPN